MISIFNQQIKQSIPEDLVKQAIHFVLEKEHSQPDEMGVIFVDTEEICKLHEQFFNDPSPTDCITIPIDADKENGFQYLGDIYICTDTASQTCSEHNLTYEQELTLYVIHATLHLLGYDDIDPEDKALMKSKEKTYFDELFKQP